MKKLLIAIMVLLILTSLVSAKLSTETLKEVDNLRVKHYGYGTLYITDITDCDFIYDWIDMTFDDEDGILYIETQNGKWFVEMKKVEMENE